MSAPICHDKSNNNHNNNKQQTNGEQHEGEKDRVKIDTIEKKEEDLSCSLNELELDKSMHEKIVSDEEDDTGSTILRPIPPRFRKLLVDEVLNNPSRHPAHFTGQALLRCVPLGSKKRRQAINQMKAAIAAAMTATASSSSNFLPPVMPPPPPPPPPPLQAPSITSPNKSILNPDAQPYIPMATTASNNITLGNFFMNSPTYNVQLFHPSSTSSSPSSSSSSSTSSSSSSPCSDYNQAAAGAPPPPPSCVACDHFSSYLLPTYPTSFMSETLPVIMFPAIPPLPPPHLFGTTHVTSSPSSSSSSGVAGSGEEVTHFNAVFPQPAIA